MTRSARATSYACRRNAVLTMPLPMRLLRARAPSATAVLLLLVSAGVVQAQDRPVLRDSVRALAIDDGQTAGRAAPRGGAAIGGFFGGLGVGFFALPAALGAPVGIVGTVTGIAVTGAAATTRANNGLVAERTTRFGTEYGRVFSDSYRAAHGPRRRKAALVGAATGGAVGFSLFLAVAAWALGS